MKDKILNLLREKKVVFFLCAALIFGAILSYIDTHVSDCFKNSFLGGILVEAHGMLMDIFVFGILVTLYEESTKNRNEIKRLHEEIDDYRRWDEPEAMYRIVGCIKRLNKKGESRIELHETYLNGAVLSGVRLQNANLWGVRLENAFLNGANLQEADLRHAYLQGAYLEKANLQGADLQGAGLERADLEGADLRRANLQGANLLGAKLLRANLLGAKIKNLEVLEIINKVSIKNHKARLVETDIEKYYEIV
jgi:Pentapeptide repeats (8 copies)